jgi:hypothetical protein
MDAFDLIANNNLWGIQIGQSDDSFAFFNQIVSCFFVTFLF